MFCAFDGELKCFDTGDKERSLSVRFLFDDQLRSFNTWSVVDGLARREASFTPYHRHAILSSLSDLYKYPNIFRPRISLRQLRPLYQKPIRNPNQYPARQTQCRHPRKTLHVNNPHILDYKELR